MLKRTGHSLWWLGAIVALLALAGSSWAVRQPDEPSLVRAKVTQNADLYIPSMYQPATALTGEFGQARRGELNSLGVSAAAGFLDPRTGRWGTLMPTTPLLPGSGVGNSLSWQLVGQDQPANSHEYELAAWSALEGYLNRHQQQLHIDPAELGQPRVTVHHEGRLAQIHVPRVVGGLQVENTFLTAVINQGNLVLLGTRNWSDMDVSTTAAVSRQAAEGAVNAYLTGLVSNGNWMKPHLKLIPVSRAATTGYRLVWIISPRFDNELGQYQARIDAHSGELVSFLDTNHYASTREVIGGVLPITNDGMVPDGVEQAGWPMPYADVTVGGEKFFTDGGGNLASCVDGTITTELSGQFMRMNDNCGAISESTAGDVLDLGTSAGTDCTVPAGASAGNTHASRSGFYEMNRIKEQARGHLKSNTWLQEQLTANMNINNFCNATWNGTAVNFYRSGGGCANTGELAGVYDHEWGHGMDNNDTNPSISSPGEGIADIYASLRLNTSCIGRNFLGGNCNGYGDPCLNCSGVRDIDWANRASGTPHDIAWIDANCGAANQGPCGGSTHCEGSVYAETVWDLWNRDLQSNYGWSDDTARELGTMLTFFGASPVGNWFNCVNGTGTGDGCNADGGYLNFLAADDDNGDLTDGTPHMQAIFDAFDRHGIACATPTVQDAGCSGTPTTAPTVTATPQDRAVTLSWGAVAGATAYNVYKTDGVFACDFGKELLGTTTDLTFKVTGLLNGHDYSFIVIPLGPEATCFGPASSCDTVAPVAGANVGLGAGTVVANIHGGDGDLFVDNCEQVKVCFDIQNTGNTVLSDVDLLSVDCASHPASLVSGLEVTDGTNLSQCDAATGCFWVRPDGLVTDDVLECTVEIGSSDLGGKTVTTVVSIGPTESDFQQLASKTFSFEADLEEWQVGQGTFNRSGQGGGADGTSFHVQSSAFADLQCDQITSPVLSLASNSTMTVWTNFDIEPFYPAGGVWYDRANFGIVDVASGDRMSVDPDGGRLYNASGANGTCGTDGQGGWADNMATWASSSFSAGALDSAGNANKFVQIDARYGTDPAANGSGFRFDQLTVTNVSVQEADAQGDVCLGEGIFADGFETDDTSAWTVTNG